MSEIWSVYAVVYRNYYPAEVDSLWKTEESAKKQCDEMNKEYNSGGWSVMKWTVEE